MFNQKERIFISGLVVSFTSFLLSYAFVSDRREEAKRDEGKLKEEKRILLCHPSGLNLRKAWPVKRSESEAKTERRKKRTAAKASRRKNREGEA